MNNDYKVGNLIYDASIYDGMNTNLADLQFYKRWLPKNKDARILELCCGTGRLTCSRRLLVCANECNKHSQSSLFKGIKNSVINTVSLNI